MYQQLTNIAEELQKQLDNVLTAYAFNSKSVSEQFRDVYAKIGATTNGSNTSLLLFLQKTNSSISGFLNASISPDPGTELIKVGTVSESDGLVLIAKWVSAEFGFLTIPAGLWLANIYAFCNTNAGNYLQLNFYKKDINGNEELLFTMTNIAPITWTDKGRLIPNFVSNEGTFSVQPTDMLVTKIYGYTDSTAPVDIKVAIAGKSKRSSISYPIPLLHNLLAGKQGGDSEGLGQYNHLTDAQIDLLDTIEGKESSSNKSNSLNDINSEEKFPVWSILKQWTLSQFLTNVDDTPKALLTDFPYDGRYISYFKGMWNDTLVPTWDGQKFAGVVGTVLLEPATLWPVGFRPSHVKITLNITACPNTQLLVFVTNLVGEVADAEYSTPGAGYGIESLGVGTNVLTIPIDVTTDIVSIYLQAATLGGGSASLEYDITDIKFYTPKHTLPLRKTDSIGVAFQKVINAISDLSAPMMLKTINAISLSGAGNLYVPDYQELYYLTDEFSLDDTTIAYIDDVLGCVMPSEGDSYFTIMVVTPMFWDVATCKLMVCWEHDQLFSQVDALTLEVDAKALQNGSSMTTGYSSATEVVCQGGTQNNLYISPFSDDINVPNGSSRSCMLSLKIKRNGSTDNFAANIFVKSVKIVFGLGAV